MGETTGIQWTDATFNPWWGCVKVSDGCKNCYAETLADRFNPGLWGPDSERRVMSEKYWNGPLKWNKKAKKDGVRRKVFCGSMCDVFEDRVDLLSPRQRLWNLIHHTEHLDWLLLTKRPENILRLMPVGYERMPNIWLGTSVEDQNTAHERIPHLLKVPARVRFLSVEPLLGPVDLSEVKQDLGGGLFGDCLQSYHIPHSGKDRDYPTISWVIVGAESGTGARYMEIDWPYNLMNQCALANVPFFMKQLCRRGKKISFENFPSDLQVREFPR